eukprot:TRINITY_DN21352_c0_g5_i2.p1 TRINITY_DN21352_c0_g5~~TRINITY_DN21352_c0_g5_i2.p1  ORF type:complete len:117 (-),score=13.35 TRINITY_DN21352_c0_g5_i2:851-1201(-)
MYAGVVSLYGFANEDKKSGSPLNRMILTTGSKWWSNMPPLLQPTREYRSNFSDIQINSNSCGVGWGHMGNETRTCKEREPTHVTSENSHMREVGGDQRQSLVIRVRGWIANQLSNP